MWFASSETSPPRDGRGRSVPALAARAEQRERFGSFGEHRITKERRVTHPSASIPGGRALLWRQRGSRRVSDGGEGAALASRDGGVRAAAATGSAALLGRIVPGEQECRAIVFSPPQVVLGAHPPGGQIELWTSRSPASAGAPAAVTCPGSIIQAGAASAGRCSRRATLNGAAVTGVIRSAILWRRPFLRPCARSARRLTPWARRPEQPFRRQAGFRLPASNGHGRRRD